MKSCYVVHIDILFFHQHISQLSLFYVEALYKTLLLDSAIMYDEKGKFQSSERVRNSSSMTTTTTTANK